MKIALIGTDIPMLLPSLLADLLFAEKEPARIAVLESSDAMRGVLKRYAEAVIRRSGLAASFQALADRAAVLDGADCVIYAGDVEPASRHAMDRDALGGMEDGDEGLTNQARVNGGLGGLMHTLRAGNAVLDLCGAMDAACPDALVICLGQPAGRMTAVFLNCGYRCFGLGESPLRGPNGTDALLRRLGQQPAECEADVAGVPGFGFLLGLRHEDTDLLPEALRLAEEEELGRLTARWLQWYGAVAVGSIPAHAELLPEQEDYQPDPRPSFGESVEQRKERIRCMNTVGQLGASSPDGAVAQGTLLLHAPSLRPVRLALALLRKEDLDMPGVIRRNGRELPQLSPAAVIESVLRLRAGEEQPHGWLLPEELADACEAIDGAARLAAEAAAGDRTALRECIETDPALLGLDRLYCQDVADRLIALHRDVLPRFGSDE